LEARAHLLVRNQAIENRQHLLAVVVYALQVLAKGGFEVRGFHPLVDHGARDVDILSKFFYVMSTEEETVKKGGFPLWR